MSAAERAIVPDPLGQRILVEQVKIVMMQAPKALAASVPLAAIAAFVVWDYVAHKPVLATIVLICLASAWWWLLCRRYNRDVASAREVRDWARRATTRSAVLGGCWGAYALAIYVPGEVGFQAFDAAFMYSLTSGAIAARGAHYRTFVAYVLPTSLPLVLRCLAEGTTGSLAVGAGGLIAMFYTLFAGLGSHRTMLASIRTRFENVDLLQELALQKQAAEAARAQAEAANLSKSRFLAAASHDLRQPVHALALFVAAAKHPTTAAERALIIERIDSAVAALAALFDSLLDISRLDAGMLQPQIKTVSLRPLLQRLAAEHMPDAQAKGLELRLRYPDLYVRSDPLLIERMIRNLLTNAIRYTDRGGALLACRRRGAHASIEVWDTGSGIAPDQQARVFEEFYQIGNVERDRRKGVGLGLAIVQRIGTLLRHSVRLESRVGRGSRFSFEVPIAVAFHDALAQAPSTLFEDETVLFGAIVVAIDDEADILAAIETLLKQWGCRVIAADSAARALALLQASGLTPDIVLSDYRLRDGETGIQAIAKLRSIFGQSVPALLITGDTALERPQDASFSSVSVLHKPLHAEQLRSALIRVLG